MSTTILIWGACIYLFIGMFIASVFHAIIWPNEKMEKRLEEEHEITDEMKRKLQTIRMSLDYGTQKGWLFGLIVIGWFFLPAVAYFMKK